MSAKTKLSIVLPLAALVLAGCGSNPEPEGTTSAAVCKSLPPLELKSTYRVGFAQLWEDNGPWRNANTASMQEEAARLGYDLVFDPGTNSDPAEQVERMRALIDAKVDAIFLAPHDEAVLAPSVVAARKACIPTFIVDRAVNPAIAVPGTDYVSYLGSDFRLEGEQTADWLIAQTKGKAQIIELEGTVGSSPGVARKQGFDDRIKKEAGMKLLVSESADFDEMKAYNATLRLVPQYPTATVIYSHNDAMSFGVITALEELGKVPGKDILIVSIDGTKKATQYILDGKIGAVTECNPKFGPVAFQTMLKYAAGEEVPLVVKNVDRVFDMDNAADYLPEAF